MVLAVDIGNSNVVIGCFEGEDIRLLEEKIESLEAEIPKYSTNFVKLNELMKEKEECEAKLEEKMDRWMYLEDLAARIKEQEV